MKLVMVGDLLPGDQYQQIIQLLFRVFQRELKLDWHQETIELRFSLKPGQTQVACVSQIARYPIQMQMQGFIETPELAAAMAHEMVHVRDLVEDRLVLNIVDLSLYFNGDRIVDPKYKVTTKAEDLPPHEREPHAVMNQMALRGLRSVAANLPGEAAFREAAKREGLLPMGQGFHGHY